MDPFDRTPANPFIQNYIARYGDIFKAYAAKLGLSPTAALAAASAISEEMRDVYNDKGDKSVKDRFLDWRAGDKDDATLQENFSSFLPQISDGLLNRRGGGLRGAWRFGASKLFNPMADDVGPGNINFGSASNLLLRYLNDPSNKNDPLNLRQYLLDPNGTTGAVGPSQIAFSKFFSDLNSLDSPATAAISMLNIAGAHKLLTDAYGSRFTDLASGNSADQQKQVGLLAAISKIGEPKFDELER